MDLGGEVVGRPISVRGNIANECSVVRALLDRVYVRDRARHDRRAGRGGAQCPSRVLLGADDVLSQWCLPVEDAAARPPAGE
jgi:hypothetical protein